MFYFLKKKSFLRLEYIGSVLSVIVSRRIIVADIIKSTEVITEGSGTSDFSCSLPNNLSEMASDASKGTSRVIIVVGDFVVPSIND